MAGRNNLSPNALRLQQVVDHGLLHRGPPTPAQARAHHHHSITIQDRITLQHRDIQTLLLDNQRLAATHVALKQELVSAHQELRHLSGTAATAKAEGDAQVREVYEKSLRIESEAREIEGLSAELAHVRADVQRLSAERKELMLKLQETDEEVVKSRSELRQFSPIQAEIEAMHHEIQRGRAAVLYEKRMHANNIEQSKAMEKNMNSMAREIDKLRAELANAEKRARATAAAAATATSNPGYAAGYGNSEIGYGGSSYRDLYALHQVQGVAETGAQYGPPGAVPHGPYDMQQGAPVHR